ncbi:hypothetical protein EVAR_46332_1 [Eumeta japonica]|uniref:Uncharacterized protein n=1 Tax=Eumeta variegata TaxID=151549 RepID=A0A4C1WU22_EUMVA|nr:hypothetical protein EVAR_46332_1 [Eumeta japonica]
MLHELQLRYFVVEAKLAINRVAKLPFPRSPAACDPQARGPRRRHNALIQLNMEDSTFHIDYDDCEHYEFGRLNNSDNFEAMHPVLRLLKLRHEVGNLGVPHHLENGHYGTNVLPKSGRCVARITRNTDRLRTLPPSSVPSCRLTLEALPGRGKGLVQTQHPHRQHDASSPVSLVRLHSFVQCGTRNLTHRGCV